MLLVLLPDRIHTSLISLYCNGVQCHYDFEVVCNFMTCYSLLGLARLLGR